MKLFLILVLLCFNIQTGSSQVYSEKIDSLKTQIKKAVSLENYKLASELKKTKELFVELQYSILNEDFIKANEIKIQIYGDKANQNTQILKPYALVYFLSNKTVGRVGGEISINDKENSVKITHGSLVFRKLNPKMTTFDVPTFKSESSHFIQRKLDPGKIYFIEYGSIEGYGGHSKEPVIRFINTINFKSKTGKELPKHEGFQYSDTKELDSSKSINIAFKNACKKCILEINGVPILREIDKKAIYRIGVPDENIILTFFLENSGIDKIREKNAGVHVQYKWITTSEIAKGDNQILIQGSYSVNPSIQNIELNSFQNKTKSYKIKEYNK